MQPNNFIPPQQVITPPPTQPAEPKPPFFANKVVIVIGALAALLLVNLAVSAWLFTKINHVNSPKSGTTPVASSFNGENTLFIDSQTSSVGVGAQSPEGLQVSSNISGAARGVANMRVGLLNGQPTIVFEDSKAQQVQAGINGGNLQLASGSTIYATVGKSGFTVNNSINVQGGVTLGASASSSLTVKSANLTIPNNLNVGSNALYVANSGQGVAIGTNNTSGYKLYVAGNTYNKGTLQTGGRIIIPTGSASAPSLTFSSSASTGIFSPSMNILSFSASGKETLRVKSGAVSTQNSADFDVAGFLQAGSGGPSWKVARFTGTLDGSGSGSVSHGITNAPRRVLVAMGWYEGSSGQAKILSLDSIDNSHMLVSGGLPGAAWRGVILYTSDTAGW